MNTTDIDNIITKLQKDLEKAESRYLKTKEMCDQFKAQAAHIKGQYDAMVSYKNSQTKTVQTQVSKAT